MRRTPPFSLFAGVAVLSLLLAGCQPGSNESSTGNGLAEPEAKALIASFVVKQRLASSGINLVPATADWSFLHLDDARASAWLPDPLPESLVGPVTIAHGEPPAGWRPCVKAGSYTVLVGSAETCPGDWIAYRGDTASSGASTLRLDWTAAPSVVQTTSLAAKQPVDPLRVFARSDPIHGDRIYVNNGTSMDAFDSAGQRIWSTPAVGIGEIIDVTDLDGDGTDEVVFSPGSRWNLLNPSGGGPGELLVLAAADGAVLWRYRFEGVEFGLNRRRTTIVPNPQGTGKSLYAVMTYSPNLWRFDFSAGARNGVLLWKSPAMAYDSPDKPPLVADFDGDGYPEVVADDMGALYRFRLSDGALLDSLQYAPFYSFRGFFAAVDLDGDGIPEIVGLSNTIYMKDAFVARHTNAGFEIVWRKEWEWGLETTNYELLAMRGVVRPAGGSRVFLMWSVRDLRDPTGRPVLELTDALTGVLVDRREDSTFLELLRAADGSYQVATRSEDGALTLTALGTAGFGESRNVPSLRWDGVVRLGRSTYTDDTGAAASTALIADAHGTPALLTAMPGGTFSEVALASADALLLAPLYVFEGVGGFVVADDAGRLNRVDAGGLRGEWARFAPKVFAAPVTADIDGDGRRELILPYLRGSAVWRLSDPAVRVDQLVALAPDQQRESFHVPAIVRVARSGERLIAVEDFLQIVVFGTDRTRRWSWQLPPTNWEPSLVVGRNGDGSETLFYNDSRMTAAFDPDSGRSLWIRPTLGQCQRQIASIDWNGDGIADVAVQSADLIAVVNGATGQAITTQTARTSYGGYIAATSDVARSGKVPTLAVHAIGGMTLVSARDGITYDVALDDPKVESIPPVIGRVERGVNGLFQVSGGGLVRRMTLDGTLVAQTNLEEGVLTMTGAYVDGDDVVDLLVSTYRGELIAISGADLRELWRVPMDGPPGPAVATDIDGDGRGEIVVVSGAGNLHVLRAEH